MWQAPPPVTAPTREPRLGARPTALWGALLLAATFAGCLLLYRQSAGMPFYYHSDEPSKVEQVTGERTLNFKHPLLLMNGTRALAHLTGRDGERQAAVHAGRTMSAVFAAACVATLAALAWLELGLWGALCVALVVAGSHGLFTYAHFMKEDTAVAFGLSGRAARRRRVRAAAGRGHGRGARRRVRARDLGQVRRRGRARRRPCRSSGSAGGARAAPAARSPASRSGSPRCSRS